VTPVEVTRGDGPVVIGLPHTGTWLPEDVAARLTDAARGLADTDWHVDRLYAGLLPGATTVRATFHRYLIDANRPPDDASLYPGRNTTGLCPVTDFDGTPLWRPGEEPGAAEIAARRESFHAPYHAALAVELDRTRARHGIAILWDAHSIRSEIPFLFDGRLPDLNIGTNGGTTCAPEIEAATRDLCAEATAYTHVLNGRFKGGWTTRHYGRPTEGLHALQMELAQSTHLAAEAPPWTSNPAKAEPLRALLARILGTLAALAPTLRSTP
jgi:N-formylglutamate deformylase